MRAVIAALAVAVVVLQSASAQEPLAMLRTIDLPRVEGRIDHLAFDAVNQRLYVPRSATTRLKFST